MGTKRDADFSINKEEMLNKKANLDEESNTGQISGDKGSEMTDSQVNKMTAETVGAQGNTGFVVSSGEKLNVDGALEGTVTAVTTEPEIIKLQQEMETMRKEFKEDIRLMSQKFGELVLAHTETVDSLKFHDNFLETLNDKFQTLSCDNQKKEALLVKGEMERKELRGDINRVEKYTQDITKEIKSENIIISGLKESKDENILLTVVTFLKKIVPNINGDHVKVAYRMGSVSSSKLRPILVKLRDSDAKQQIMKNKSKLKDLKSMGRVFCNDDLHEISRKNRQRMRITAKYAAKKGYKNVKCAGNKLQIDGKAYQEDELGLLHRELHMDNIMTQMRGGRLLFERSYSYLSGSYKIRFQMNDKMFSSADQALYYHKAILCGRDDVANDLMDMSDAKAVKGLGQKLDSNEMWEDQKLKVMKGVLLNKFQQNPKICGQLVETMEVPILNCDSDHYWGTGKGMFEKEWNKTFEYPGTNALGTCLEEVRKLLIPAGYVPTTLKERATENASPMEVAGETENGDSKRNGDEEYEPRVAPGLSANGNSAKLGPATAKEMSALIRPTTVPDKPDYNIQAVADKADKVNLSHVSDEDSLEQANKLLHMIRTTLGGGSVKETKSSGDHEQLEKANKYSSNVGDSIIFGDNTWEESAADMTHDDGRLNRDKLANLVIPRMNRSKTLEKSLLVLKEGDDTGTIKTHKDGGPTHSTPMNTKFGKSRGRKPKKKTSSELKNKTLKMLKDLEL